MGQSLAVTSREGVVRFWGQEFISIMNELIRRGRVT